MELDRGLNVCHGLVAGIAFSNAAGPLDDGMEDPVPPLAILVFSTPPR
jgi:hypothetical protein